MYIDNGLNKNKNFKLLLYIIHKLHIKKKYFWIISFFEFVWYFKIHLMFILLSLLQLLPSLALLLYFLLLLPSFLHSSLPSYLLSLEQPRLILHHLSFLQRIRFCIGMSYGLHISFLYEVSQLEYSHLFYIS